MMNLAILGFGTVGVGVYEVAQKRADLHVKYILDLRDFPELGATLTHDIQTILNDPAVDTVIEVMGGLHPAFEFVSAAMRAGKNVVTANKYLVCSYFSELTTLAAECGVSLRCTAAAGGGIPWLVNLERAKRVDSIHSLWGIMNGTTNFILDAMQHRGAEFADVLAQAQELGYAEVDPTADIDGWDIQRKLIISANIAFDCLLDAAEVSTVGIRNVTAADVRAFQREGLTCRLLAKGYRTGDGIAAFVEPTLVTRDAPESAVPSNFNLITFVGEAVGRLSFFGQGAGRYPTACNCVQDCLNIASGFYSTKMQAAAVDNTLVRHAYYVRTSKPDAWLDSVAEEKLGDGIRTKAVDVKTMHEWLSKNPDAFIAGIEA